LEPPPTVSPICARPANPRPSPTATAMSTAPPMAPPMARPTELMVLNLNLPSLLVHRYH
jgi:hypothetical protein